MGRIEKRIVDLGLELPLFASPVANYLGTKQTGNLLFASARVSPKRGIVGADISEEEAYEAARCTILLILAIVKNDIKDLDLIHSVIKMQGFVRSSPDFLRQPQVIDGASDLLIELWGEHGKHARTATGVNQLPYGASVQLDVIFEMKK